MTKNSEIISMEVLFFRELGLSSVQLSSLIEIGIGIITDDNPSLLGLRRLRTFFFFTVNVKYEGATFNLADTSACENSCRLK